MEKIPPMVDMRKTQEEVTENCVPCSADLPMYPYGLSISLGIDELAKLNIDPDELDVDDLVHMHCMAVVTSKSTNANISGNSCRIELQITHISAEDEDEENQEKETVGTVANRLSKLYKE